MKVTFQKLTESIIPVVLLLFGLFFVLVFVEYRASEEAERDTVIYVSLQNQAEAVPEEENDTVFEDDYSDDPRIVKAQELIAKGMFDKAEEIYFGILAKEPSTQIYNWLGTLYLKQQSYDKAIVSFSSALRLNSRYFKARYNRALAYSALDEDQQAISDYQAVIQDFDNHAKSHFNLGLLFYRQKEYADAADEFKRTVSLSSGDTKVKALYLLGRTYSKLYPGRKEMATEAFNEAIRLKPDHIASRLALVELAYPDTDEGYQKRLDALEVMLQLEPDNIAIYRAISEIYLALKKPSLALKVLQKALLHEPGNIALQFEVAEQMLRQSKVQEAVVQVQNILSIDPASTKAYFLLGRLYYELNDYEASDNAYAKLLALKPEGSPELWYNLGLLYTKMERYDEAGAAYHKALQLRSNYPESYYNLGLVALKQKNHTDAIRYFNRALKLRPDYYQAYYNLAIIDARQGDEQAAIKSYQKVLQIKPDHVTAKLNLAVRYAKIKAYAKAQAIYEEVLERDDSYFTAWLNLGLVYYQQKQYQHALEALEKAVALEPENEKAYRALAKNYSVLKMHKEANAILQELLAKNPSDVKTRLAYARSYYRARKFNTALREYEKVLKLDPDNAVAKKMIEKIQTKKRKKSVSKQSI